MALINFTNRGFSIYAKNMKLDFNAIAQGYTVDLIAKFYRKKEFITI